ncbi:alpha/beta hydrolase [Aquibacillus kalidii]|uniref:alpha/beta hydrolase n=1 Tax=Aquibacillus kalidii TaxID=2762597 RepID=UPI001646F03E|nr:alpha/beta hydrolase [Aquibacillus kalidii]
MKKKKFIIVLSIVVVLLVVAYGAVGNYFYNFALNAQEEKDFLEGNEHLQESEAVVASVAEAEDWADEEFAKENEPSDLTIVSQDDLELALHADVYENDEANHKWAIVTHGYSGRASHMTRWVRNFHDKGYNVLAPDLRGHGESEGNYIGMGWHDRLDMLQWIDEIIQKDSEAEIVLLGVSMGGATVMMTSGEELPSNVKVIVEDCGYSTVSGVFTYQLKDLFNLPEFPVINAADTVAKMRAGYGLYEASAVEQVAKSKTPMLFIHGDQDSFVPYEMLDEVYEAAQVEKEKLVIEGAGHGEAVTVNPALYWNTVWGFVDKYM